ncbi:arsenate reductase (glutaredoxin) [Weeksellaceae bacterium KMM 9713]|uniref:Arsenate reductase (Glutaredoxin) n=1 Tax=Profundicola chukchiensis TaxID=2961959 RepID=A0A9X4N092_9FLAO|nr:arsenate reductase (glutaredoxin) [Profundicola chukchiensis]MDG4945881.1 arsenate reductase (glutaredoxin) [Profundicola chukchiensis]
MIKIYHNPRCSKSRQGVKYLEDKGLEFEVIQYLKDEFTADELKEVIQKLNIKPIELVRTKEAIWKENYKDLELSDDQIIQALVENPRLIERPIVVNKDKAVVARPTEDIEKVL